MKGLGLPITAIILCVGLSAQAGPISPDEVSIKDGTVAESLTGAPGDPAKGREWFVARKLGNCLACHQNESLADEPFHGEIGPDLTGVGERWSPAELRAIVVNAKAIFGEESMMPAFYRTAGLNRVGKNFAGKTILTAEQVEDVVAYLSTLK